MFYTILCENEISFHFLEQIASSSRTNSKIFFSWWAFFTRFWLLLMSLWERGPIGLEYLIMFLVMWDFYSFKTEVESKIQFWS